MSATKSGLKLLSISTVKVLCPKLWAALEKLAVPENNSSTFIHRPLLRIPTSRDSSLTLALKLLKSWL
jgi:hypothetical protein